MNGILYLSPLSKTLPAPHFPVFSPTVICSLMRLPMHTEVHLDIKKLMYLLDVRLYEYGCERLVVGFVSMCVYLSPY